MKKKRKVLPGSEGDLECVFGGEKLEGAQASFCELVLWKQVEFLMWKKNLGYDMAWSAGK